MATIETRRTANGDKRYRVKLRLLVRNVKRYRRQAALAPTSRWH